MSFLVLTNTIVKRIIYSHLKNDPISDPRNLLLVCKAFNTSYSELFSNENVSNVIARELPHRVIGELVIDAIISAADNVGNRHVTSSCHKLTVKCGMPASELKKVMVGVFSSKVTPHTVSVWLSLRSLSLLLPSDFSQSFAPVPTLSAALIYESVRELTITDYIDDTNVDGSADNEGEQDISVACMEFQDALLSLFPSLLKLTLVGHSRNNVLWINLDKLTGLRELDISGHSKVAIAKFPPNLRNMNWTFPTTAHISSADNVGTMYYTDGDVLKHEELAKPKFPTKLKSATILQRDDQDVLDCWNISSLETLTLSAFPGFDIIESEFVEQRFVKTLNFVQLQSNLKVLVLNAPCDVREIFGGDSETFHVFNNVEKFVMDAGSWRRVGNGEEGEEDREVEVYHKRFDNLFRVFPKLKHLSITVGSFLEQVDLLGKETDGSKVFSLDYLEVSFKYKGTLSFGRNDKVDIGYLKTSDECHDIIFPPPGEIVGWTPSNISIKRANVDIQAYHKIKNSIDETGFAWGFAPGFSETIGPQVFIGTFGRDRDYPDMNLIMNTKVYLALSYRFFGEFRSDITEELFLDGNNRMNAPFNVTKHIHKSLKRIYLMSPNVSLKFDEGDGGDGGEQIELVVPKSFEVPKNYLQNKRVKITRVKLSWLQKIHFRSSPGPRDEGW